MSMKDTETPRVPDRAVEAGRGALFIGAAKAFFMISAFLQKWLLTRIVGSADFGAFSVVNAAVSVLNNATVQGTLQSVAKFTAEDDRQADSVKAAGLRLQLIVGAGLGLGFFLLAPVIADFYDHPEFTRWFRLVALIPFFYSLYSVFVGSANGLRRFRTQAGFDITFSTLKTILLLGGAALLGLAGAFGGFVMAAGIILIVSAVVMRLPSRGATPFSMKRLVYFMTTIVAYTLLINLALNYDLLLLRHFAARGATGELANQTAGHYEAVRNFALLPYQALLVVTFVIFPLVSKSTFEQDRSDAALRFDPRDGNGVGAHRPPPRPAAHLLSSRIRGGRRGAAAVGRGDCLLGDARGHGINHQRLGTDVGRQCIRRDCGPCGGRWGVRRCAGASTWP
jgi:stage V sporulation protein B